MSQSNVAKIQNGQTTAAQNSVDRTQNTKKSGNYGKTVGQPKLSEEAAAYYEELKKKYGNMDFILVSEDQKENAKAMAGSFANPTKPVVLIDEEKIERMAVDEQYRKQYEGIISGATTQLSQLKSQLMQTGANVKGYGMQVNDGGTVQLFAVMKKSTVQQKTRLEKKHEKAKAEKKAEEKKTQKKEKEEKLKNHDAKNIMKAAEDEETVTVTAGSIEELLMKVDDFMQNEKLNATQTQEETMLGQHVDFRG